MKFLHRQAFNYCDKTSKGYLTTHECQEALLISTGQKIPIKTIQDKFQSGSILYEEFDKLSDELEDDNKFECMRSKFNCLDEKRKGFLTFADFVDLTNRFCSIPRSQLKVLFSVIDQDCDGFVSFNDLKCILE